MLSHCRPGCVPPVSRVGRRLRIEQRSLHVRNSYMFQTTCHMTSSVCVCVLVCACLWCIRWCRYCVMSKHHDMRVFIIHRPWGARISHRARLFTPYHYHYNHHPHGIYMKNDMETLVNFFSACDMLLQYKMMVASNDDGFNNAAANWCNGNNGNHNGDHLSNVLLGTIHIQNYHTSLLTRLKCTR